MNAVDVNWQIKNKYQIHGEWKGRILSQYSHQIMQNAWDSL